MDGGSTPIIVDGRPRWLVATLSGCVLCLTACNAPPPLNCGDPHTPIHQVQGSRSSSPLVGQQHTVEGVVTALLRDEEGRVSGAFVQSVSPDRNPDTSDALFAMGVSDPPASLIRMVGTVTELDRSLTALNVTQHQRCGDAEQPPAETITLPLRGRHIESLEAMRIRIDGRLRLADVSAMGSRGEAVAATGQRLFSPTEVAEPGELANQVRLANLRRSITLDDLSNQRFPDQISWWPSWDQGLPTVGDSISELSGVLDHNRGYRLRLTTPAQSRTRPRTVPSAPDRQGSLRVAGFNVLNLFNGDGKGGGFPTDRGAASARAYQRQLAKVTAAITALNPDIIALAELENDGAGDASAVRDLSRALSEASGRPYQPVAWPAGRLGDDAIAVGLLFATDAIAVRNKAQSILTGPFSRYSRPPLAQTFVHLASGASLTVVSLHLKSKSCGEASAENTDQRDGQGCWNPMRLAAARALDDWIDNAAEFDPARTLLIGDLNAYSREDPVRFLAEQGFASLVPRRSPQYSYVYRGAAGSLDHALGGAELQRAVAWSGYWHVNADYSALLDYHQSSEQNFGQKSTARLYQPDALRSSDHDPVVVDLKL